MRCWIMILCALVSFVFFGCAGHTYDPNKDYSFNANPGEIVQNPKQGESRIYVYRPSMTGVLVSYDITLHTVDDVENNFQSGYFVGRPYFSLVDKKECIKNLQSLLTKESLQQWQKDRENFYKK